MEDFLLNTVGGWVLAYVSKYPEFASVLLVVGFLRLAIKPIMTLLQAYVDMTPYDSDNLWLKNLEQSRGYKFFVYVLDWLLSVKMPEKPKQ